MISTRHREDRDHQHFILRRFSSDLRRNLLMLNNMRRTKYRVLASTLIISNFLPRTPSRVPGRRLSGVLALAFQGCADVPDNRPDCAALPLILRCVFDIAIRPKPNEPQPDHHRPSSGGLPLSARPAWGVGPTLTDAFTFIEHQRELLQQKFPNALIVCEPLRRFVLAIHHPAFGVDFAACHELTVTIK
jgi:hypothetical protein